MKIDSKASFLRFVYPFVFEPNDFDERCERVSNSLWPKADGSIKVWNPARFPKEDLLPHVERYLNPENDATAQLWTLNNDALQSPHGLAAGSKQSKAEWRLVFSGREILFRIEACHLSLFRVGVGLVTFSVEPEGDHPEDWIDFLHYFRFASGQRDVSLRLAMRGSPFFPSPAGGLERHPDGIGDLIEILAMLLRTANVTPAAAQWWEEIFIPSRTLPFASLYFDEVEKSELELLLYRVRCFFHTGSGLHPPPLADIGEEPSGTHRYAENQYFTFSLDGGAFIAFDAPHESFFRETLPDHLRQQYFLIFTIALHQRFALLRLSAEVAGKWPLGNETSVSDDGRREELLRDVRKALLLFTARGYFTQIMQRANHHRCYQKWQETFQIDGLHREVTEEVREMHNYLLMEKTEFSQRASEERAKREREFERAAEKRSEALQTRVSLLGLLIGGPALVIGFLGINMVGVTSSEGLSITTALVIGFAGGLALGALGLSGLWLFRKRR